MVAITVILAAVIGSFVLGLGDSLGNSAPSVAFDEDQGTTTVTAYDDGGTTTVTNTTTSLTITAMSGDTIDFARLNASVDGTTAFTNMETDGADGEEAVYPLSVSGEMSAGTSVTIIGYDSDGVGNNTDIAADADGNLENVAILKPGDTVSITWSSQDGSSSSVLFESDIN